MASLGTAIVGDSIYGKKKNLSPDSSLLLAATYLRFTHPTTQKPLEFQINPPSHISNFIDQLEKQHSSSEGSKKN